MIEPAFARTGGVPMNRGVQSVPGLSASRRRQRPICGTVLSSSLLTEHKSSRFSQAYVA